MPTLTTPNIKDLLNGLKKTDFVTVAVKKYFPEAKHRLIFDKDITDFELGNCYKRIGYFYLPGNVPIIYTHAMISLDKVKKELIEDLLAQRGLFGELLREHYPNSKIESETVSFKEKVKLPDYFQKVAKEKLTSRHERYIIVDGKKIAIAIEYI